LYVLHIDNQNSFVHSLPEDSWLKPKHVGEYIYYRLIQFKYLSTVSAFVGVV